MACKPTAWVGVALLLVIGPGLRWAPAQVALPPESGSKPEPPPDNALGQNPTPPDKKAQPVGPPAPAKKVDIRYPADAVLIVTEQATDVLKALPKYVILSPEKHQEYLDEIARLRAQLEARKTAQAPSSCRLKGKIDGNLVVLQAQFGFATETPGAVVNLACSPAFAGAGAQIDGNELPNLKVENGGFSVQVAKPGDHQLTMDLTLQVVAKGDGRGFEMDLPRAAITEIDLEMPNVKEVRRDGKALADPRLVFRDGRVKGGLGPADKLDLSWKDAGATANLPASLVALGKVHVQIDDRETLTHADLTLKAEGGQTNVWNLVVPPGATVQVAKEDEGRVQRRTEQNQKYISLRTIQLKEPSGEPLNVTVTVKGPAPRPGGLVPVGPFTVVDAQRQSGSILVSGALSNQRLLFIKRGTTEEVRLADDERRPGLNGFRYTTVAYDKRQPVTAATGPASLSWLDIDAENVHGQIEAKVAHVVRLARDDAHGRFLRVKTTIDARPVRPGADHIDLLLPPGFAYDDRVGPVPAALVRQVETDVPLTAPGLALGPASAAARQKLDPDVLAHILRFTFAEQLQPFQLTVESSYLPSKSEPGEAILPLPRPLGMPDRGGQVTVLAADDIELLRPTVGNAALKLEEGEPRQQLWRSERFPEQIHVLWQVHQPLVRANALVDLTFTAREVQVRHRLRFQFPGPAPTQVALTVPDAVGKQVHLVGDGDLSPADINNQRLRLAPLRPPEGKDGPATLDLEYSFALPGSPSSEPFTVPLVVPVAVTQGDIKVRIWGDLGATPSLAPGMNGWTDLNIEEVKENPRLPGLVLLTQSPDTQLSLRLNDPQPASDGSPPITVLIDRALIRVRAGDGGQDYRASFLVTQLASHDLDMEFPAPIISLNPRVILDNKDVDRKEVEMEIVDEMGRRADGGRFARLRLSPELVRRPVVLEVSYHLPAGRASAGPLQTVLQPPIIRGDSGRAQTRWLVVLPTNLVVLGPEAGPGSEPTWAWQGWLPAPRCSVTNADLERWFAGPREAGRTPESDLAEVFVPSLVCTRTGLGPITAVHAPQQVWLLVCSLLLLACGLGLFLLVRPRPGASSTTWVGVTVSVFLVLMVAVVLGRFLLPTLTAAVFYGCLPGLGVLLIAFAVHLLMQEHHRRQIVFLPSFTRGRGGSSVVRVGSTGPGPRPQTSGEPRGEPSTVDLVPSAGSNPRPLVDVLRTDESSAAKNR
jgi:hypothetical protein